ncbi:MAG: hypothetical protein NC428_13420 [Clostridium sp.]|nr:hypothetical protein [Clostridium sp.]
MVTLTFKFKEDRVREAGYTVDELLTPMREHSMKYGIDEIDYGVFAKDGMSALGAIGKYIVNVPMCFLDYMSEWTLNVDGDEEDCIEELKKSMVIREKYSRKALRA